ncbi:MAG: hypothetical protein WC284_16460 [Candidimonas sp.]
MVEFYRNGVPTYEVVVQADSFGDTWYIAGLCSSLVDAFDLAKTYDDHPKIHWRVVSSVYTESNGQYMDQIIRRSKDGRMWKRSKTVPITNEIARELQKHLANRAQAEDFHRRQLRQIESRKLALIRRNFILTITVTVSLLITIFGGIGIWIMMGQ